MVTAYRVEISFHLNIYENVVIFVTSKLNFLHLQSHDPSEIIVMC